MVASRAVQERGLYRITASSGDPVPVCASRSVPRCVWIPEHVTEVMSPSRIQSRIYTSLQPLHLVLVIALQSLMVLVTLPTLQSLVVLDHPSLTGTGICNGELEHDG